MAGADIKKGLHIKQGHLRRVERFFVCIFSLKHYDETDYKNGCYEAIVDILKKIRTYNFI